MIIGRRTLPALLLVPLLAAVLLSILLACYHRKDYTECFRSRSRPAVVKVTGESVTDGVIRREITVIVDSGINFNAAVSLPLGDGPYPAAVILGGYRTGKDSVGLIPQCDMVVAGLDYPYDKRKPRGLELLSEVPAIRQAILDTPSAAIALLDYLETLPEVDRERTVAVGVSLGGPFALAAAASDQRFDGVVVGYACGNLARWARTNLDAIPWLFRRPAGRLIGELAHPLEPLRYAHLIAPRPLLLISSSEDSAVPHDEVERLYRLAGEPKTLHWVGGPHVKPNREYLIDQLARLVLEWIGESMTARPTPAE